MVMLAPASGNARRRGHARAARSPSWRDRSAPTTCARSSASGVTDLEARWRASRARWPTPMRAVDRSRRSQEVTTRAGVGGAARSWSTGNRTQAGGIVCCASGVCCAAWSRSRAQSRLAADDGVVAPAPGRIVAALSPEHADLVAAGRRPTWRSSLFLRFDGAALPAARRSTSWSSAVSACRCCVIANVRRRSRPADGASPRTSPAPR